MRRRHGFTLIEVMVSLGVMTIGALAIISLQVHVMRANDHAKQLTVATQIAQTWIERLKQDAFSWNAVAIRNAAGQDANTQLAQTAHLITVWNTPNIFTTITNTNASYSNAFDYFGNDVANTGLFTYCASHRLNWVWYGRALRTDVRVWWARPNAPDITVTFQNCTDQNQLDPIEVARYGIRRARRGKR